MFGHELRWPLLLWWLLVLPILFCVVVGMCVVIGVGDVGVVVVIVFVSSLL